MVDNRPPDNDDTIIDGSPEAAGIPRKIGQYTIKREIARGGMGVVFEAVQDDPRRTVAIKVMKKGIASDDTLRRFRYESQLLARLRHPGIAQVFEAGTHDDGGDTVPFFAMEYIPNAKTLTEYVQSKKLSVRDRLELFAKVCDAVHHGHQRGIIHRDLKPGNILVDSSGQPRIIDFGVARATDSDMATIQTEVGQIIGSLQYMSPEQFDADPNDIDTRSDVYALGVVMYELMRGELPYDVRNSTIIEAARVVQDTDPPRLSQTDASLRGDVETITFKALEKDRNQRYQSANGLRLDIERYLNGEPIAARPPSVSYQLKVFARRHKSMVFAAAAVVAIFVGAAVVSTGAWIRADRERGRAEAQTAKAQAAVDYLKEMVGSAVPKGYGDEIGLGTVLDEAARGLDATFKDDPAHAADLHSALGHGYTALWRWSDAERHFEKAVDIRLEALGPQAEATMDALADLQNYYRVVGRIADRRRTLETLLEYETAAYGGEDERPMATKATLSLVLAEDERLEAARGMAEEVCVFTDAEFGSEAEETMYAELRIGLVAFEQNQLDEAEKRSADLLARCEKVLGPDDELTRRVRSLLGGVYVAQGQLEKSAALYGNKAAPSELGIVAAFQGDPGPYRDGKNIYVFWESW